MKKSFFKVIPVLAISGSVLFAQYGDYNYQNDAYNYQNNAAQNGYNYNNYNQNNTANNSYYNYYDEFMKSLSQQANDPNSIYYSPTFSQQYNSYLQNQNDQNNQNDGNPYQNAMNAMNAASDNYQNNNQNGFVNPYEELIKMLEKESQNPNSPYYSPNGKAPENQNNNNTQQDYNTYGTSGENPYEIAAQELIKAAEELSKKAQNNNYNDPQDSYATAPNNYNYGHDNYGTANNYGQDNYGAANNYDPNNNYGAANNYDPNNYSTANNYDQNNDTTQQNYNFYAPFNIPQAVLDTAKKTYPNAEIWEVDMEYIDIYEIKMSNMMELYIDKNGKLLYQKFDD